MRAEPFPHLAEIRLEGLAERAPQGPASAVDGVDVDPLHPVREVAFGRQGQDFGRERAVDRPVAEHRPHGLDEGGIRRLDARPGLAARLDEAVEAGEGEGLSRVPAREGVRIVGEEGEEILVRALHLDPDRRGELAQHGGDRRGFDAVEHEELVPLPDVEQHRAVLGVERSPLR